MRRLRTLTLTVLLVGALSTPASGETGYLPVDGTDYSGMTAIVTGRPLGEEVLCGNEMQTYWLTLVPQRSDPQDHKQAIRAIVGLPGPTVATGTRLSVSTQDLCGDGFVTLNMTRISFGEGGT